jgi:hypothetical protein
LRQFLAKVPYKIFLQNVNLNFDSHLKILKCSNGSNGYQNSGLHFRGKFCMGLLLRIASNITRKNLVGF